MMRRLSLLLLAGMAQVAALAADFDYGLQPQAVAPGVHAFIGRTEDFNRSNGGNIVNTGVIIGRTGLIVIDTGPSLRYGQQLRAALAGLSGQPVVVALNTHHHPDHFLGNQAFADVAMAALPGTAQGIARDGNAFAENLFRLSGDWMKGSEVVVPRQQLAAGPVELAGRRLRLIALDGHTGADLAVYDEASGVLFAGDLVFNGRAPTTPHAEIDHWLAALDRLEAITAEPGFRALVPGHGAVARDASPIRQTRDWLTWLRHSLQAAARAGRDMNEVLALPLPERFAGMPLAAEEYRRSVNHLFPAIEEEVLQGAGHAR